MNTKLLGRTGAKVSPLCLGCMNFGSSTNEADSIAIMHRALDADAHPPPTHRPQKTSTSSRSTW